jgi:hypothetical protein
MLATTYYSKRHFKVCKRERGREDILVLTASSIKEMEGPLPTKMVEAQ